MQVEEVPVADLHEDPANARRHPERNVTAIRASLARFGQQTPIVVDASNVVRKGNGTLVAARALGWETIRVVRTPLAGVDAAAYAIGDNRTSELAEWDDDALAATLEAIRSEPDFPLDATGFTTDEVDALLERLGGEPVDDPEAEWQGMPEFEHEDLTPARTIHVHFKGPDDVRAFAELVGQPIGEKTRYLWYPPQEIIRYGDAE
jgi:hypothetical protein